MEYRLLCKVGNQESIPDLPPIKVKPERPKVEIFL
jgi:hypothetical protein